MRINYSLTKDDILALEYSYLKNLPKTWKSLNLQRYGVAVLILVIGALFYYLKWIGKGVFFGVFIPIAIIFILIYPKIVKNVSRKNLEKQLQEQPNMVGDFIVDIKRDGIHQVVETAEGSVSALISDKILGYEYKNSRFFIFLPNEAYVTIPISSKVKADEVKDALNILMK